MKAYPGSFLIKVGTCSHSLKITTPIPITQKNMLDVLEKYFIKQIYIFIFICTLSAFDLDKSAYHCLCAVCELRKLSK